jgi:WD40 repeat protein
MSRLGSGRSSTPRFSSFSSPLASFGRQCLDWSPFGISAIAADRSILLYRTTKTDLNYSYTVDLNTSSPVCLKFHPTKPLLAIGTDHNEIWTWNPVSGDILSHAKFSKGIIAIEWKDDIIIVLRKPKILQAVHYETNQSIWKLECDSEFSGFSIDPFSQFRIVLFSEAPSSFQIVSSESVRDPPIPPFDKNTLSGSPAIFRCVFHPQVAGLIVMVLSDQLVFFELRTKSLTRIPLDETSGIDYKDVLISPFDMREIVVQFRDSTLACYRSYHRLSSVKMRRSGLGDCVSVASEVYHHRYLSYSTASGLSLLRTIKGKLVVIKTSLFTPIAWTCFDVMGSSIAAGSADGLFWLVDIPTAEPKLKIRFSKSGIVSLKFQSPTVVFFITEAESGSFDLSRRELQIFNQRCGVSTDLLASDDLAVFIRSNHVIGLVHEGKERPVVISQPFVSVAPQNGRTPATCFCGNSPNLAVMFAVGVVRIYSYRSPKAVLTFRLPSQFENPSAIVWRENLLAIADLSGLVRLRDFEFGTDQLFNVFPAIIKMELVGRKLLFLAKDGTLGTFHNKTMFKSPIAVRTFAVGEWIAVRSSNQMLRMLTHDWERLSGIREVIPSRDYQLRQLSAEFLQLESKSPRTISKLCERAGFPFESIMWQIIGRVFDGPPLPMRYSAFGKRQEIHEQLMFVVEIVVQSASIQSSLFLLRLKARLHDLKGVSEVLLGIPPSDDYFLVGAIAGALMPTSALDDRARETLRMTAISLFARNQFEQATTLLQLCGLDLTAVEYLQEYECWADSVEILKTLDLNDKTKSFLRRYAHYLLNAGKLDVAALSFASIGDFHPLLAILVMMNKSVTAFHVMMYLDSIGVILPYDEDTERYQNQFPDLETIRVQIIEKSEVFLLPVE